jgi:hypothetical protein
MEVEQIASLSAELAFPLLGNPGRAVTESMRPALGLQARPFRQLSEWSPASSGEPGVTAWTGELPNRADGHFHPVVFPQLRLCRFQGRVRRKIDKVALQRQRTGVTTNLCHIGKRPPLRP